MSAGTVADNYTLSFVPGGPNPPGTRYSRNYKLNDTHQKGKTMTMPNGETKTDAVVRILDQSHGTASNEDLKAMFTEDFPGETVGDDTIRSARKRYADEVANAQQAEAEDPSEPELDGDESFENELRDETAREDEREAMITEQIEEDGKELGEQIAADLDLEPEPETADESPENVDKTVTNEDSPADAEGDKVGENEPIVETIVIERVPAEGRCNHRMPRAATPDLCGRPDGHPGVHTTYAKLEEKKAYSKNRAKVRYHEDPSYAERAKAASRESHRKAREAAKAAKDALEAAAKADDAQAEADTAAQTEDAVVGAE